MKKVTNTSNDPKPEWLFGGNPNLIEAQELQGQKELVNSSQLPIDCNFPRRIDIVKQYETMGIKVIGKTKDDELFFDVELPKGWKMKEIDHSMWNELLDDKGRSRASIFYKAAFYDRSSHITFNHRYFWTIEFFDKPEGEEFTPKCYCVIDSSTGQELFRTEITKQCSDSKLEQQVKDYLNKNYPNHEDINAYWD